MTEAEIKSKAAFLYKKQMYVEGNAGYRYFKEKRELWNSTIKKFCLGYDGPQGIDYTADMSATDMELADAGLIVLKENGFNFDRFKNRVIFPIWNEEGIIVAFGGRWIGPENPDKAKYINTKETPLYKKSATLYALNFAKDSPFDSFILCEGYLDVISLHQAGFTNAIAACGTSVTDEHIRMLKKYGRKIYVATDTDVAGNKSAMKVIKKFLIEGIETSRLDFSPYKDVDEALRNGVDMNDVMARAEAPEHFLFRASEGDMEVLKWLLDWKMSKSDI